jgi:hypothetical protein
VWQLYAYDAFDHARDRRLADDRRRALRHPGGIDVPFRQPDLDRGPGPIRRASARVAAAVSHSAASLARSLDERALDPH